MDNHIDQDYLPGGSKYTDKVDKPGDATLNRVRALLTSAEDASYAPEVQAKYRERAEALMFQYKISLLDVKQGEKAVSFEPQWREVFMCPHPNEFYMEYLALFVTVMSHCSVRGAYAVMDGEQGRGWYMKVVGFVPDLQYMEMLATSALMAFGSKLEPKFNPALTEEENIYAMRSAGMERGRISRIMWPDKFVGKLASYVDKGLNKKVTAVFLAEAAKRDESANGLVGKGVSMKAYRHSYAEGFVDELWRRLKRMKLVRGNETHAVQLANVASRVEEAFYKRYPGMRPTPFTPSKPANENCERCKQAKSGYCREHGYLKPSNAKGKDRPFSYAGMARGQDAARTVDLGNMDPGSGTLGTGRLEVEGS